MVREIIRRARACRWKPHAALFKLNLVRIIIGGQLSRGPSRLIPRDRICEYEGEKEESEGGKGGEEGRKREGTIERGVAGSRERETEREEEEDQGWRGRDGRREGERGRRRRRDAGETVGEETRERRRRRR